MYLYMSVGDERLKSKDERSTRLGYTVYCGGLEHLKIFVYYETIKRKLNKRLTDQIELSFI